MLTFVKQNKVLSLVVMLFVFAVLYYAFFANKSVSTDSLTMGIDAPSADTQQLLSMLANLRTITLTDQVFKDPVFLSLHDFSVVLTPQPAGRHNPFEPIGAGTVSSQNSQITMPALDTRRATSTPVVGH